MKFFTKIFNFVKKAFRKIAEMFKDKNPVEVINDTVKTVAAVGTAGLAIYTGINAIRVRMMSSKKKNKNSSNGMSGHEILMEKRKAGSIDEKLADLKRSTAQIGKQTAVTLSEEELDALKSIAKTRNVFFQNLSPEEQLNVLEIEEFDFKEYVEERKRNSKRPLFHWGGRLSRLGVSPKDKPFREPVDYGFFNFILRPIDDFIHWLKNDPVPKKVPQIQLVDHPEIPQVECETAFDLVDAARDLDSYLSRNNPVSSELSAITPAFLEEQTILADEIFRHKTLKKLNKAVNARMAQSMYNTPNIFDMMDDEKDNKKKKKKDKDKKKKKKGSSGDHFSSFDEQKPKKKGKMSKEDAKLENDADKRAQALYRYHLEKAMAGETDRKGFGF